MPDRDGRDKLVDVRVNYARLAGALTAVALVVWFALANRHEVTITS